MHNASKIHLKIGLHPSFGKKLNHFSNRIIKAMKFYERILLWIDVNCFVNVVLWYNCALLKTMAGI